MADTLEFIFPTSTDLLEKSYQGLAGAYEIKWTANFTEKITLYLIKSISGVLQDDIMALSLDYEEQANLSTKRLNLLSGGVATKVAGKGEKTAVVLIPSTIISGTYKIVAARHTSSSVTKPIIATWNSDEFTIAGTQELLIDPIVGAIKGDTVTITWDSSGGDGYASTQRVLLYYAVFPEENWIQIDAPDLDAGPPPPEVPIYALDDEYEWTIPPQIPTSLSGYRIKIEEYGIPSQYYVSDIFNIAERTVEFTSPLENNIVVRDSNGETFPIKWEPTGFASSKNNNRVFLRYRKIDIVNGNSEWTEIQLGGIDGSGPDGTEQTYNWQVLDNITEGTYQLGLFDSYQSESLSDNFTIVGKNLNITAPLIQTQWDKSTEYNITWVNTGYEDDTPVVIDYELVTSPNTWQTVSQISDGTTIADESFALTPENLTVPMVANSGYRFRISVLDGSDVVYYYTDFFSIIDGLADFNSLKYETKLVSVCKGAIYCENSDHEMVKVANVTASDIDPITHLAIVSAGQKVFVADGRYANFKMLDLSTVKITGATDPLWAVGSKVTQAGTGASGVLDRVEGSGTVTLYIYKTTAANFVNPSTAVTGPVVGTKSDGTTATLITGAADNTGPYWGAWTAQAGALPTSASIACLYRGRVVLAGDAANPHMWYMSAVNDPYDWDYSTDLATGAVAGHTADVGELGDIITALIPYHDDQMIFGCAHEMHLLRGDAQAGGSLDSITTSDGVFGPQAWCFDDSSNLYFIGNGGLYIMPPGGVPQNISSTVIPSLMMGVNRDKWIITLEYDRRRRGIYIWQTQYKGDQAGQGRAWWYDLSTQGFFPESYVGNMMPYSSFYYSAEDSDYEQLAVGCSDGYIRYFDDTSYNDEGTHQEQAIQAEFLYSPISLGKNDTEGRLSKLIITTDMPNSTDTVDYKIFVGDTAKQVVENSLTGDPVVSGTITGTYKKSVIDKASGGFLAVKIESDYKDMSFAIDNVSAVIAPVGRIKI